MQATWWPSDEKLSTSDEEDTSAEVASEYFRWCQSRPDSQDDPTEEELVGAAEKVDTKTAKVQPSLQYLLYTSSRCAAGIVAPGQIDFFPGLFPRLLNFPDNCCGAMAESVNIWYWTVVLLHDVRWD